MPQDDDGRPSFAEVVQAFTPPGTDWGEFKAAMRQVHQDGGYRPGQVAPDISMSPGQAARLGVTGGARRLPGERCSACGADAVVYRSYQDQPFCGSCASGQQAAPADPFSEADAPSVALAEMFHGMIRAGIPVASVESILGKMLAEHGRDAPEKPDDQH
jgi:hypothetical protein